MQVTVQSVEGGVLAMQEQAARTLCLAFLSEQVPACACSLTRPGVGKSLSATRGVQVTSTWHTLPRG